MYFETFKKDNEERTIYIELNKNDVDYLLKEKELSEFDNAYQIRIVLTGK